MPSLTSFVLIGLAFVSAVNAEECSTDSLMGLASNTNLASCTAESGISMTSILTVTQEQMKSVCETASCMALMSDVASLGLGDCTIPGSNVSVQSDVLDPIDAMCGGSGSMGSMDMVGSSSSSGTTNVGDSSTDSSSSSDNVSGGSSSSSESAAATVTIGCVSTIAVAVVAFLL